MLALPNALTILRVLLVPVFAIAFVLPGDAARLMDAAAHYERAKARAEAEGAL